MQSFPPYNQIDNPAASKSKLNSLLIILIITFFASGAALIILKQIDTYHRNQLYIAEQAALPIHKEVKASNSLESAWVLEGKNLKLPNFNNLSLNLPDGWYLAQPAEIQSTQQENVVFSALVCNFTDCGYADKDKTPAGFSSFRIVVAPEYSEYRDEDIAKFADSKINLKLKNGSAIFYEITKPKKNIEDLILPTYSALAMSEGKEFAKNYDVILTQGTHSALENKSALKAAMLYILKSVQFGQDTSKNEAWKTYKNEEYGFSFEYPQNAQFYSNLEGLVKNLNIDGLISVDFAPIYSEWASSMRGNFFDNIVFKNTLKIKVDNIDASTFTGYGTANLYFTDTLFYKNDYLFKIEMSEEIKNKSLEKYNKLLSTFKFTK